MFISQVEATIKSQAAALQLSISTTSATAATFLLDLLCLRPKYLQEVSQEQLERQGRKVLKVMQVRQEQLVLRVRLVQQGRKERKVLKA